MLAAGLGASFLVEFFPDSASERQLLVRRRERCDTRPEQEEGGLLAFTHPLIKFEVGDNFVMTLAREPTKTNRYAPASP